MDIQVFPLSEGVFTIGHDKVFIPFDEYKHDLLSRSTGSLLVEIQPFLVQVKGHHILFDSGLGFKTPEGQLQIHSNLRSIGIEPSLIDMVILSHLHKDHTGGLLYTNELGVMEMSFPNATYYIGKQEFSYAMEKGLPSYKVEDFDSLKNSPHVEWLDEKGSISDFISYETDGGHCPYHISFLIQGSGGPLFFGGDVAPQLKQLKTRYIAKYDFDGRRTMELRQKYAHKGKEEGWTFLFYHDVKTPYSKV